MVERVNLLEFVRAGQLLDLSATETLRAVRKAGLRVRTSAWWAVWRAELERRRSEGAA